MTNPAAIDPAPAPLGTVYLVGAGPGDPGLLTLKGRDLLEVADVLVYDALVSAPVLAMVNPKAKQIDVGKRSGRHTLPQSETTQLLIDLAQDHAIIVRLKGGDPFVFGRGGEEMEDLVAAGVPVEVVPGVTSGIAAPAYSGIPLTHRAHSSSAIFVTGHEESNKYRPGIDWQAIAKTAETIVIYMGIHTLPQIVPKLIAAGKAPDTPIALIRWGTRPNSQTLIATLETVAERMQAAEFAAPAIAIIGTVVNLHQLHVHGTPLGVTAGSVMSSPLPDTNLTSFYELCRAIDNDIQQRDWEQVSENLKHWAKEFRGTLSAGSDRQRLVDAGITLLLNGEAKACRGLAPVFRYGESEAIDALHATLSNSTLEFEPRWFSGQILAKLKRLDAMEVLVAALDSSDEITASIAIDTLSHFSTTEIDLLVRELKQEPDHEQNQEPNQEPTGGNTRQSVVRALSQISDPVVITPLLSVIYDPDPTIRLLAIAALSAFDDDRVIPVLIEALSDTSAPIRKAALTSLGAKAQYQQRYGASSAHARETPAQTMTDWLNLFQPLTLDLNLEVALQAVIAIGRLSSERATDVLIDLLRSPLTPPPQALATVRALLQHPSVRTIDALLSVCQLDPVAPNSAEKQTLALELIRGLGRLHEPNVMPETAARLVQWCDAQLGTELNGSLTAHDPTLLQTIAYSLGNLGEPIGQTWLERLAGDSRDRVRVSAIAALQKLDVKD